MSRRHTDAGTNSQDGDHLFAVRLMEHLVVPTFVLDRNGRVIIWNRACEQLTGFAASELLGTREHWRAFYDVPRPCLADLILEGNCGDIRDLYATHARTGSEPMRVSAENWCVMPRLGSRRYLAIDAGPIYDEVGQLLGVIESLRDVTVQKEGELALNNLKDELQNANRAYALVNAEFQRQNAQLLQQERALSGQTAQLQATLDNMYQGLLMLDADLKVTLFNTRFVELLGFSARLHTGMTATALVAQAFELGHYSGHDFAAKSEAWFSRLSRRKSSSHLQKVAGGRTLSVAYVPIHDGGWVITYEDITERERAEAAVREQKRRLDAALNNMAQGLCMFDENFQVVLFNERFIEIFGFPPGLVHPGVSFRELLAHNVRLGNVAGPAEKLYQEYVDQLKQQGSITMNRRFLDGRTVSINHRPMVNGGWVATYEDVTEQKEAEARIAYLARHDALTGLPNRTLFRERMEEALERVPRGEKLAVVCLDLDRFKAVNDTLGHSVGDALLKAVTERLRQCVRKTDTVARLGGDEFAILHIRLERPDNMGIVSRRLIEMLSAPYEINGHQIVIGASVGVAFAPEDGNDADTLLKNADMALYRAKAAGRGAYRFFEPDMDAHLQQRRQLELDLREAFSRDAFEIFYQPLVEVRTERITGFEALLRWPDAKRGMVFPSEFIPVAEEIGLIVPLGEWVIRKACADASMWPAHVKVAVNLSPTQFRSAALVDIVASALASSGLKPKRLELEITESVLLQNTEATLATLHRLRGLGVQIVMDDFGTGYSSLSYLRSFPFDRIKIDRSFVKDLGEKAESLAIIKAVAGLGATLGIATTAEGIETPEQLRHVREHGCTEAQGYLFSIPICADDAAALTLADEAGPRKMESPPTAVAATVWSDSVEDDGRNAGPFFTVADS